MSQKTTDEKPKPSKSSTEEKAVKPKKKVAAKKSAAKKVAKKASKKASAKKASVKTPPAAKPIEAPAPLATPSPLRASAPGEPKEQNENRQRNGRVPGGGPVQASADGPDQSRRGQTNTQDQAHSPGDNSNNSGNRDNDREPHASDRENKHLSDNRDQRSSRRRDRRGRRGGNNQSRNRDDSNHSGQGNRENRDRPPREERDRSPAVLSGPVLEATGLIELTSKGFGFLRLPKANFAQDKDDIFIPPDIVRDSALRHGQWIDAKYQDSSRGPQITAVITVNSLAPEDAAKLPHFDELTAINPNKRIAFETTPDRYTTRVVDIVSPVGRGQRGLIVSPPRSGKTTLLLHMAEAIQEKYDEQIHLMIVLVDERPEEVTEFRRALPDAEIYASSNDEGPRNHCRIAELAIERAKRLVEAGQHVFLLMDSITRLARAYNGAASSGKGARGRGTGSGGITIGALEVPRRLFAAARNTREAGSLTILATALIQTNSRADEAIFMEFKGTGNMELVLDRKIAESYVYPAVDIFKSGTRREELLLAEHTLHKIHLIRRGLSGHRPHEAMERLLYFVKKFPNNPQMLLEIKG